MVRKEDAEEAVKDPNPTIDGRRANVNLAYMGAKNRTASLPRRIAKNNDSDFECILFLVGYSLLARMPTYQSTATAYPYVNFFFLRYSFINEIFLRMKPFVCF
jgi:hypothetical protein